MRIRLTLREADLPDRDVVIDAPAGTALAAARTALVLHRPDRTDGGPVASGDDAITALWSGRRLLPDGAVLGGPGLREGSVVHLDRPAAAEAPGAILHLDAVGGPDSGLSVPLPRGVLGIGRGPDCDVRLIDPDVSRVHAELTVTASGVSLRDLDSTNGTVVIGDGDADDVVVDRDGITLPLGNHFRIGDTVLRVTGDAEPAAVTGLDPDGRTTVNRPPRPTTDTAPAEIVLPEGSRGAAAASVPWLAALLPALLGAGLAWSMHNLQFLAFALLSPVMMLGGAMGERVTGRRRHRHHRRADRAARAAASAELSAALAQETRSRREADPDPATLARIAAGPGTRLWERRPADPDAARVRVGLATQPATTLVRTGQSVVSAGPLSLVPYAVDLATGSLGVCGPAAASTGLARWLLAQLVTARSPVNLRVIVLASDDRAAVWRWTRWLPHLTAAARDDAARRTVVTGLVERLPGAASVTPSSQPAVHTVVLVDRARLVAQIAGLDRLVAEGPAAGIVCICVEDDRRRLPPGCAQVVEINGDTGTRARAGRGTDELIADRVSTGWLDALVRSLAPLTDPTGDPDTALPDSVRLLDLLDLDRPDPQELVARWARSAGRPASPVALGADGPIEIDLARDGPHTLIAGTTGSGKSELLQTLVAGIAVKSDPDAVRFVLIDYKGGAAFAECADLPHVTGLVTDLDAHLTRRALISLDAELRRRETMFAAAGVSDLESYRREAGRHGRPAPGGTSLGRLVIVVDEFAALAEELPEFVTGLVGVAQRGRSLGVHLVLATQRPGGAVSPEIRANTTLRIALRVTDPAESLDVIGSDRAAAIESGRPGRAMIRTGERLITVQAARIGGPAPTDSGDTVVVRPLSAWGEDQEAERPAPDAKTDLRLLVDAAREAAVRRASTTASGATVADPPWLAPLPDTITVAEIQAAPGTGTDGRSIVLGLADHPTEQRQAPLEWDLARGGTLLAAGGPRSGRTTLLRTLAVQAARAGDPAAHVYVIDCAGGSLRPLAAAAACGAVITRDDPDAIERMLARLGDELQRRHALLGHLGAGSAADARAAGHDWPALVLLVDGWTGFVEAVERIDAGRPVDTLLALIREAPALGMTLAVTGDRSCLGARLAGAVEQRLVLRMADPADYPLAGLSPRDVPEHMPAGRALRADGTEVQLALLDGDPAPVAQWRHLPTDRTAGAAGANAPARTDGTGGPFRVRSLPVRVGLADLDRPRSGARVLLGAGGDDAGAVGIDLDADARVLVSGPPRSGRSTLLALIAHQSREQRPVVLAAPRRSGLAGAAAELRLDRIDPDDGAERALTAVMSPGTLLLVDDADTFADTDAGEALGAALRDRSDLAVVLAARNDELALSFRGLAAEVRRHRCGILLDPQPGDGDLVGVRLPIGPGRARPVGRAVAVLGERLTDVPGGRATVDVQIALR